MEVSKGDWKLFRARVPEWQENHMDKLNKEYIEILQGNEAASEKFLKLEERIKRDKKHPGVIMEMRKSEMVYHILILLRDKVIGLEDLDGFSEELKEQVDFMMQRWT